MAEHSRLPPLAAVRAFEAAARLASFTRAGAELGMSQAAVSYQIRLLEDRVGAPLFLRLPRGVRLTDTGRRLAVGVGEAFDTLRAAFAEVAREAGGVLTISAIPAFATNWLAPRIGAFQLRHPEIAVRMTTENRLVDFAREEVDVALRAGRGGWPGLVAHRLYPLRFTPVCSPDLLRRFGPLREPADLLRLPLLTPTDPWWRQWFADAGVAADGIETRAGIVLDSQQIEGRAALAGQGVAMLTPFLWAAELAGGRLVQPFPLVGDDGWSIWLIYPEARRNLAKVRAWRDWLLGEVARKAETPGANSW
jgi:LysR family glycine cleavage system transcriptional activator